MKITYKGTPVMTTKDVVEAMNYANKAIRELSDLTMKFDINIFDTLGLRNLSGMVGELLAKSIKKVSAGKLESNPHQDGYPDLLMVETKQKKEYLETLYTIKDNKRYPVEKKFFSPFKFGGIEVKATCGDTPPAKQVPKPLIGEQRVSLVKSFVWKAHHRGTSHLLAVLWDFIDGLPTYVAAFYQENLVADDWGKITKPKEEGGRTTSVSIMKAKGVKKMCGKWVAIINDEKYIDLLSSKKWIGYRVDNVIPKK